MFKKVSIDATWEKYNLLQHELSWKGSDDRIMVVEKEGQYVMNASLDYKLLPNEEAVKIANNVAKSLGAIPFDKFGGDWFTRVDKHTFYSGKKGHQVHALFAWHKPVQLGITKGGKPDMVQLGFAVHNSIDKSMGFSVGIFTFRHACANMVFMGFKGQGMDFDDRKTLAYIYKAHRTGLDTTPIGVETTIKQVIATGKIVMDQYNEMQKCMLSRAIAVKLYKALPNKILPDYLTPRSGRMPPLPKAMPLWEVYNDITEAVWHDEKTDYASKLRRFNSLHAVLDVGRF